jgi:hypothetical protein
MAGTDEGRHVLITVTRCLKFSHARVEPRSALQGEMTRLTNQCANLRFLDGTLVGGVVNMLVDFLLMRRPDPRFRQPLSGTERFFLDALRLHAAGSAQHLDLEHLPATAEDGPWRAALADYAAEYPDRARQSLAGDSREAPR